MINVFIHYTYNNYVAVKKNSALCVRFVKLMTILGDPLKDQCINVRYKSNHLKLRRCNSHVVCQVPLLTIGIVYHDEIDVRLIHHQPVGGDTDQQGVTPGPVLAESNL